MPTTAPHVETDALAVPVAFAAPCIGIEEIDEVAATLSSGWLTTGARVREFERAFADYVGAPYAVAVNSCTAALHLSLLAAGVGPGDEVITSPLTFCATANTIIHAGATPVFADVDRHTGNISPERIEAALTPTHEGDPSGALRRPRRGRHCHPADCRAPRTAGHRGRRARGRSAFERREGGRDRRLHLLQLLRDEESDDG